MPVINVKKDGVWQDIASTYKHAHTVSDITDLPASFADDIESLKDKVGADSVAYQINTAIQANEYVHPYTHPADMITGLSDVAISGDYNDLTNLPTIPEGYTHPETHSADMITGLATVATSGDYNDLTNKPTIPSIAGLATTTYVDEQIASVGGTGGVSEQVQSDWDETDTTSPAYIKNKPVISGDGGASVQADWNQTDETAADFIKNKPFGEVNASVNLIDGSYKWIYDGSSWNQEAPIPIISDVHLTEGNTYTVTWNGVEYECECFMYMGMAAYVGNTAAFGGADNGMPFTIAEDADGSITGIACFMFMTTDVHDPTVITEVIYDIKLSFNGVATKKIDTKYLYHPDWNITDKSNGGYIMNKPFGIHPAGTVLFDGSLSLFGNDTDSDGNTIYEYIGMPNINMMPANGHTLCLTVNGTEYSGVVSVDEYGNMNVTYTVDDKEISVIMEPESDPIFVTAYIAELSTITLTFGNDEIQTIPKKYLPSDLSLPEVTTSDDNKILTVVDGTWIAQTPASGLPEVTTSDVGKFLRVSSSGVWVAETVPSAEEASF